MSDDTRYAYAVARIRGMETRILSRQQVERLLSEPAGGALRLLSDTAYQDALSDVSRPEDIEAGLTRALVETLTTVSSISPEPELIDLFRVRWDFRNLKSLLKAALLKVVTRETGVVEGVGTVDVQAMEKAVRDHDHTFLPDFVGEVARAAEDEYRDNGELAGVDRVVDAAMWKHSIDTARRHRNDFLVDYFRTEIDLGNVRMFARMKEAGRDRSEVAGAFVPGGTLDLSFFDSMLGEPMDAFARAMEYGPYGELAEVFREWSADRSFALELASDNLLLRRTEPAYTTAYGIEPLVRFILVRGLELKLIRAAVAAKLDGVGSSEIEARLRVLHV
ncbi:MAG: V-type ATPase subunit [Candidatus Eisenbacteria bacterium]